MLGVRSVVRIVSCAIVKEGVQLSASSQPPRRKAHDCNTALTFPLREVETGASRGLLVSSLSGKTLG